MRLKVKNFSIFTALVLALSLVFSFYSFAEDAGGTYYTQGYLVGLDGSGYWNNYKSETLNSVAPLRMEVDFDYTPMRRVVALFNTAALVPAGTTVEIEFYAHGYGAYTEIIPITTPNIVPIYGVNYYTGSCIGGELGSGSINLFQESGPIAYEFDEFSYGDTGGPGQGFYGIHAVATETFEYTTSLAFQFCFMYDGDTSFVIQVESVRLTDASGNVIDVIKDGIQQIIVTDNNNTQSIINNQNQNTQSIINNQNQNTQTIVNNQDINFEELKEGYNNSTLMGGQAQLDSNLNSVGIIQSEMDILLQDSINSYDKPELEDTAEGFSFVTSSLSLVFDTLGAFSSIIVVSLFLCVFNFISRYRS